MVTEKVKGVISCPICKKGKVIAYESASGKSSVGCHNCGRWPENKKITCCYGYGDNCEEKFEMTQHLADIAGLILEED